MAAIDLYSHLVCALAGWLSGRPRSAQALLKKGERMLVTYDFIIVMVDQYVLLPENLNWNPRVCAVAHIALFV